MFNLKRNKFKTNSLTQLLQAAVCTPKQASQSKGTDPENAEEVRKQLLPNTQQNALKK